MRIIAPALQLTLVLFLMLAVAACGSSGSDADATAGGGVADAAAGSGGSGGSGVLGDASAGDNAMCVPECAGRVCGDDGCGGTCGACSGGQVCNLAGACTDAAACTDTCEAVGAACGVVCGQGCGVCAANEYCAAYQCVAQPTETGPEPDASGSGEEDATTPPPLAVCGDGVCNGTESCLTCVDDCGACVNEEKYYCFEMNACVMEGCDTSLPSDQLQACFQQNMAACQSAGETPQEYSNWYAWQVCLSTCMGQTPTPEKEEECFQYGCPAEVAECFSGGTYGEATCAELDTCLNQSCTAMPLDQQSTCMRDCFATGTEDAIAQQTVILFCMSGACAEETTPQGQQECLQAAMAADGACADAISICAGGASASECDPACAEGESCVDGTCEAGTVGCDPACAEGESCVDGTCEAAVVECDPACAEGESCVDGTCLAGTVGCDPACSEGESCVNGTCEADTPALCDTYCELAAATCTDTNAIDFGADGCQTACGSWTEGALEIDDADTLTGPAGGDTVACRIYHLSVAGGDPANGGPEVHCPHAAPDGGGVCVDQ